MQTNTLRVLNVLSFFLSMRGWTSPKCSFRTFDAADELIAAISLAFNADGYRDAD